MTTTALAYQHDDGSLDLDSIAETVADVRLSVLETGMGWRFEHPDRYSHDEAWARALQYGRVVWVEITVTGPAPEEEAG